MECSKGGPGGVDSGLEELGSSSIVAISTSVNAVAVACFATDEAVAEIVAAIDTSSPTEVTEVTEATQATEGEQRYLEYLLCYLTAVVVKRSHSQGSSKN